MKTGRNIVFCNFSDIEKNWITINDIRDEKDIWTDECDENHRFPYIKFVDNFYDLFRSNGFIAVIKAKDINYDVGSFDKKNHKRFKKFNYIAIVDEKYKETEKFDKYSKIGLINYDLFTLEYSAWNLDTFYKKHNVQYKKNYKKIKKNYETKIIKALQNNEINSKQLSEILNVSIRTVERYMFVLSNGEYSIRYNKKRKCWYLLK